MIRMIYATGALALTFLFWTLPAIAGLPDRYVGDTSIYSGTTQTLRPNVLFLVDTSRNMGQGGGTEPYDPGTVYTGSYNSNSIYLQLNASSYQLYVADVNTMGCAEGKFDLQNYGFFNGGLAKTSGNCSTKANDIGNYYLGNLLNKTQMAAPEVATWAAGTAYSVGAVVQSINSNNINSYRCIQAGISGGTEPAWPTTAGGQVDDGTAKWEITATLMDVVKAVLKQASGALRKDLKLGLMTVGSNNAGGWVRSPVQKMATTDTNGDANFSAFTTAIDSLGFISSNTSMPMNEALYDSMYYYKGMDGSNLKLSTNYTIFPTPIDYSCQKNYVVMLTTGSSTPSSQAENAVGDQNGDGLLGRVDDVAKLLYETDMLADQAGASKTEGYQRVQTTVIQLMTSYVPELDKATNGSHGRGDYVLANNTNELIDALLNLLNNIVREAETAFVAPVVPASPENRTYSGKRIYIGFFKPMSQKPWFGNLKKFGINEQLQIVSAPNADGTTDPATNADGTFNAGATSFWSPSGDAGDVQLGGVGGKLQARTAPRNIWTWTGNDAKRIATDPENYFVITNTTTALSAASLGVPEADRSKLIKFIHGYDGYNDLGGGDTVKREWILGDILHAKPLVVNYQRFAITDESDATRNKTYIFQGANDGMLHCFRDVDGEEEWAFIPPDLLPRLKNLRDSSHSYLIDSTPSVYIHDANNDMNIVKTDGDRAVLIFGLRRGGGLKSLSESGWRGAYYLLDVSDPKAPVYLGKIDSSITGFSEMAQTWSQPRLARVRIGSDRKIVAFVGAGYDNIEDLRFGSTQTYPPGATETIPTSDFQEGKSTDGGSPLYPRGRGIYAIEIAKLIPTAVGAATMMPDFTNAGALVWGYVYGSSEGYANNLRTSPDMSFSIVSEMLALDRDIDGFIDRIYVGDLGGNLWRFNVGDTDVANWSAKKVFSSNPGADSTNGRKIFYKPDLVMRDASNVLLLFGTGDRAHPMNYLNPGSSGAVIDRLYAVRDDDSYTGTLTESNLHDVTTNKLQQEISVTEVQAERQALFSPTNFGWYIRLQIDGNASARAGEKVLAPVSVFNNVAFFTTYQPDTYANLMVDDNPCDPGNLGFSRLYAVNAQTGEAAFNFNTTEGTDLFGENQTSTANERSQGKDEDGNAYILRRADRELSLGGGIPSGMVFIIGADGSVSAITAANIAFPAMRLPGTGTIYPVYWNRW